MLQNLKKHLIAVLLLFCLIPLQANASVKLKINRVDAGKFPVLKAIVSVEQDGIVLDRLSPSDFKVAVEGSGEVSVSKVASLEEDGENVAMVLAVDTSGSMKRDHLNAIKDSIKKLIKEKKDSDVVALISFNDDVVINCDFTKDAGELIKKVDGLKASGKFTVLFKAVYKSIDMLENNKKLPRLRYTIVLSDGKNEGKGYELSQAIKKANDAHIPIYSLGFLNKKGESQFLDNMESAAAQTGGEYRKVDGTKDLIVAYSIIADKILKQQVLTLDAGLKGDGGDHNLEIRYQGTGGETSTGKMLFNAPILIEPPKPVEKKTDCAGVAGGSAYEDNCGNCVGGNTGMEPCTKDCAGVEGGTAYEDKCGECVGGNTNKKACDPNKKKYLIAGAIILLLLFIIALFFFVRSKKKRPEPEPPIPTQEPVRDEEEFTPPPPHPLSPGIQSFPMENPLVLDIPSQAMRFPLTLGKMLIGAYSDNNLVLDSEIVSGVHAQIQGDGKEWILKDLNSTNGTRLNGDYITEPVQINEGDLIRIGPFDIHVIYSN